MNKKSKSVFYKEILITKNFTKDPLSYNTIAYPLGERFIGRGLVTEIDHEKWRERRATYNPGFNRLYCLNYNSFILTEKVYLFKNFKVIDEIHKRF